MVKFILDDLVDTVTYHRESPEIGVGSVDSVKADRILPWASAASVASTETVIVSRTRAVYFRSIGAKAIACGNSSAILASLLARLITRAIPRGSLRTPLVTCQ